MASVVFTCCHHCHRYHRLRHQRSGCRLSYENTHLWRKQLFPRPQPILVLFDHLSFSLLPFVISAKGSQRWEKRAMVDGGGRGRSFLLRNPFPKISGISSLSRVARGNRTSKVQ
ncbi:hypothetical protein Nepgr_000186 [Nepenthes gracilis]|uniref:Uncharacterized protein n=1 Tax=Nepenthes gracilis TaxID=150966 RepID=A0AAD3P3H2_NEPGR|nr:hypothetical protein Nepgr_000186 [Nepenthes gracilis]